MSLYEWLRDRDACREALAWLSEQSDQSAVAIWTTCNRGDWLLWWAREAGCSGDYAEVARRAANRSRQYAQYAYDDRATVEAAENSQRYAIADNTRGGAYSAARSSYHAAAAAGYRAGYCDELRMSADDCRELISRPAEPVAELSPEDRADAELAEDIRKILVKHGDGALDRLVSERLKRFYGI